MRESFETFAEYIVEEVNELNESGKMTDAQLQTLTGNLVSTMVESFVEKPTEYDYDELSTGTIREGLRFLEDGITTHFLSRILPEAMVDAVVETLETVLKEREKSLAKGAQ